jgi:hypothetical protein
MNLPKPIASLVRVVAGDPRTSPSHGNLRAEKNERNDYCSIGVFAPNDAPSVLDRFQGESLRFQVGCDTSGGPPSDEGFYRERTTIEIYVHPDDADRARKIIDAWRISVGKVSL